MRRWREEEEEGGRKRKWRRKRGGGGRGGADGGSSSCTRIIGSQTPTLRLLGKSRYSEGIADHYWPWLVFLSDLISSRAADPKETMSYRIEGENFYPSMGGVRGFLRS